jgi:multidrug efflux pump
MLTLFTTPVIYLAFDRVARRWGGEAPSKQHGPGSDDGPGFGPDGGHPAARPAPQQPALLSPQPADTSPRTGGPHGAGA